MFTLPSLWNMLVSSVVFVVAAWYIRRFLEDQEIPKGMTRGVVVFTLAYLVSWASGAIVDLAVGTKAESQLSAQMSDDVVQLMKQIQTH